MPDRSLSRFPAADPFYVSCRVYPDLFSLGVPVRLVLPILFIAFGALVVALEVPV
jgi:hypothetical protein